MNLYRKLLLIIFIFFCFFAVSELLLRLFKVVPTRIENESIYPGMLGDYKPSQRLVSDHIIPHRISINSLGLRGKEISIEKTQGTHRILILGDSYTFGARVSDDETFPFQLEQLLNNSVQKQEYIEVINAGHSAYSTREEYEYLLERGARLNPDIVILAWFPNDIVGLDAEFSLRDLLKIHYKFEPWKSYIRRSAIFNSLRVYISYLVIKLKFGPYVPKKDVNILDINVSLTEERLWNKCFDYILKIKDVCDKCKIRFIIVTLVSPVQIKAPKGNFPQQKMIRFFQEHKIEFLDTSDEFLTNPHPEDYYLLPKDSHFSREGNKIVAKQIYEYLKEIK